MQQAKEGAQGSGRETLPIKNIKPVKIPIAPMGEQTRIVERIHSLRSQVQTARNSLLRITNLLKQFRESVLVKAFRGELTERDPNDEPAEKLLERIREERRKKWEEDLRAKGKDPKKYKYEEPELIQNKVLRRLPEGWSWTSVRYVSKAIQYGYTESSSKEAVGPRFVRITDIQNGKVNWELVPYCRLDRNLEIKYLLEDGDILFARSGATTGKTFIVKNPPRAIFASYLIRVKVFRQLLPEYLFFFFNSQEYWSQLSLKGIAQPNANSQVLGKIVFPLAPRGEQERIVAKIQELFGRAEIVEKVAQEGLRQAELLEQSILSRAFRGELVPQDPNDEPASVLLERIRAQRAIIGKRGRSQTLLELASPAKISSKA